MTLLVPSKVAGAGNSPRKMDEKLHSQQETSIKIWDFPWPGFFFADTYPVKNPILFYSILLYP